MPTSRASPRTPRRFRLLWEVCRVPDYRKVMHDHHVRLLAHIYRHLAGPKMRLPEDWVHRSITRLDRTGGDIDLLMRSHRPYPHLDLHFPSLGLGGGPRQPEGRSPRPLRTACPMPCTNSSFSASSTAAWPWFAMRLGQGRGPRHPCRWRRSHHCRGRNDGSPAGISV